MKIDLTNKKTRGIVRALGWEVPVFIIITIFIWLFFELWVWMGWSLLVGSIVNGFIILLLKVTGLYFYNKGWDKHEKNYRK